MFEHTSRYFHITDAYYTLPDGQRIAYKARRFLPRGDTLGVYEVVTVEADDRLDLIAARTLGDPLQFWRIADANDAMDPHELTARPGRSLIVPTVQAQGL